MTTFNEDLADTVFAALAHRARRQMLDILRDRPGMTVGALAANFDVSRITVMQHLRVLTDANLVVSEKDGRARRLYLNGLPLHEVQSRWLNDHATLWANRALDIKAMAEAAAAAQRDRQND